MISDIHLGDWGLQIGLVIAELSDRHPEWRCFASDFGPESDSEQYIPELRQILESQNLLRLSDGALVVDVAQAEDCLLYTSRCV